LFYSNLPFGRIENKITFFVDFIMGSKTNQFSTVLQSFRFLKVSQNENLTELKVKINVLYLFVFSGNVFGYRC
jgi:hypothetical protein